MSAAIDAIYAMRNMAGAEADKLKAAIKEAQAVFEKLDKLADDMERGAQLLWESQQPTQETPDDHPTA